MTTDQKHLKDKFTKNLSLFLLTLLMLVGATIAWFLSMTIASTSNLNFLSKGLDYTVNVTGEGLYREADNTYLSADFIVPGQVREYQVEITNHGDDCEFYFGIAQVVNYDAIGNAVTSDGVRLSEAVRVQVGTKDPANPDGPLIPLTGEAAASKDPAAGTLIGNQESLFLNDTISLKKDETATVFYRLGFLGKNSPVEAGNEYGGTRMTAAIAVSGVQSN